MKTQEAPRGSGLAAKGEAREERESQGGGGSPLFSAGDERSEAENTIYLPGPCEHDWATAGPEGAATDARGARAAAALPCLNTINCNEEGEKGGLSGLSAGHKKTAYALEQNVLLLAKRHGLERIGFLTLTFARQVVAYKKAQSALHSLITGVIKPRYSEFITVMERMTSGRIHYHLLVSVAQDIRTGFDLEAVQRGDYRSAGDYLRLEWRFWRATAPKYGFGRTALLPIKRTAEGVAKYVGKYIGKHIGQRLPEDKGARLVRYSKGANPVGTRFSWKTVGAGQWRAKLGALCHSLNYTPENFTERLGEDFGKNWVHGLRPLIESIKLPEFHPADECHASVNAAWLTALNERERYGIRKRKEKLATKSQLPPPPVQKVSTPPVRGWASWIERSAKEDASKKSNSAFSPCWGSFPLGSRRSRRPGC